MSAKLRLQDCFQRAYDSAAWPQILQGCFPLECCDFFDRPEQLDASVKFVKSTQQIGNLTLGDDTVALLVIEVSDQVQLNRNRVALRNFVARFIDEAATTAVLAVFHQPDKPDWRVTYAARSSGFDQETLQLTSTETAPRRYTFLVGPNEPCRTVAGRFAELETKGSDLTLADVEKAFSVERLNKEFFKTYKQHYEGFRNHLLGGDQRAQTHLVFGIDPDAADDLEIAEKPVRDFVKRLLGRIVFIHFLQKKRWMGCPAGQSAWEAGDPEFLYNVFKRSADPARFHSADLVPLFYGALNTPDRPGDIFEPTGTRIPYLNGGLFEPIHGLDETRLDFPETHFEALLDFFAQYNFTIDENDPEEQEVGIDPEMLGHIFENLLEDNKDKGAYYTPKAIVQYMAQQSLIYYLLSHLDETDESRAAVEYLVRVKQLGEGTPHEKFNRAHARRMSDLLDAVKICDPAIGSGAFPIGLLQEIFWLKLTLNPTLNEPGTLADLKRGIIQNSIYGVDLDAGAIDIARLRFWLALIVDEDAPRALPNLDYKIMQGDSLLESFEGIDLSKLHTGMTNQPSTVVFDAQNEFDLDGTRAQEELVARERREAITAQIEAYYSETVPQEKKRIHDEIDQQVRQHIAQSIAVLGEELDGYIDQREKMLSGELAKTPRFSEAKAQREIAAYQKQRVALAEKQTRLEALQKKAERPYFLWHLYFQEVFAQGGFDIVVANPPYVRQEAIKDYKPLLKEAGYACFTGTADLFVYFYERAGGLLREGGALTFITSNKYYRAGYGAKLRSYLTEQLRLRELLDFGDAPVFDAIAYASILIGQKRSHAADNGESLAAYTWKRSDHLPRIAEIMGEQAFPLEQTNLTADGWRLERPDVFALLKKLREKGTPLGEYAKGQFHNGIKTGFTDAFIIDDEIREGILEKCPSASDMVKPYFRGRNLRRWKIEPEGKWLLYIPWHFPMHFEDIATASVKAEEAFKEKYRAVYEHLLQYKERLSHRDKKETGIKYEWYAHARPRFEIHKLFDQPKIVLGRFMNKPTYAYDDSGCFHNDALFFISLDDKFLLSFLNSNVSWWFLCQVSTDLQNGYLQALIANQEPIPIPEATPADRDRLSALAEAAATATGADLEVIETEINQIVYRLFDLTDAEIQLIEDSLKLERTTSISGDHGHTKDKEGLFRQVRSLAERRDYFTFEMIKDIVRAEGKAKADDTLYEYIGEAVSRGFIHSAGKGWYSSHAKPLPLNSEPVQPLVESLQEKFPLLPICCWSSAQLNPYLEHLLGVTLNFVTVEADAVASVAEYLEAEGINVAENPRGAVLKNLDLEDDMVIIRPGSLWENYAEGPLAPWEVLLVHASQEVKWLEFIDRTEFREGVARALSRGRVSIAPLLAYLRKMKIPELDIFPENYRVSEKI